MFIGHYGPAAAVAGERFKLWHGFIAAYVVFAALAAWVDATRTGTRT